MIARVQASKAASAPRYFAALARWPQGLPSSYSLDAWKVYIAERVLGLPKSY